MTSVMPISDEQIKAATPAQIAEIQVEIAEIRDDNERKIAAWYVFRALTRMFAELDWQTFREKIERIEAAQR